MDILSYLLGKKQGGKPTQTKTLSLGSAAPSTVTPDEGYSLGSVTPSIDTSVIKADNIRQNTSILGVTGTLEPAGSTITASFVLKTISDSTSYQFADIAYGKGVWVAVDKNYRNVAYSTDLNTWTQLQLPYNRGGDSLRVSFLHGMFIINGSKSAFWYSQDGVTWASCTGFTVDNYWTYPVYGNGKYVSVSPVAGLAAYSTDGITWTEASLPSTSSSINYNALVFGNGVFIVGLYASSAVMYSSDGITWTRVSLSKQVFPDNIIYANGVFVLGRYSKLMYSTDGLTWTEATITSLLTGWKPIAFANGKFIAAGYAQASQYYYATSADGVNWSASGPSADYQWLWYGKSNHVFGKYFSFYNAERFKWGTDILNLSDVTMPTSAYWSVPKECGGKLISICGNNTIAVCDVSSPVVIG